MTSIATAPETFTLINTFTVDPENQQAVIDLLIDITERVAVHLPGFLSATVHRGITGRHIANYVQWQTAEQYQSFFDSPEMQKHMDDLSHVVNSLDPLLYKIEYTRARAEHG